MSTTTKASDTHHSSTTEQTKWQWILAENLERFQMWIFLHPVDNEHHVCVDASPSSTPSLLVQPELISLEYKKQHGISRRRGHLLRHWILIYSYLQPSFPQRIGMRRLCRLFNAVERLTMENPRRSMLLLMPIPNGVWTTFPNRSGEAWKEFASVRHDTLENLIVRVNKTVEASPDSAQRLLLQSWGVASPWDSAPRLLFLQEGAPDAGEADDDNKNYDSLSGACIVVDETGCFHLSGEIVTDDDVVRVAREYSNLQSLNLFNCENITDASLLEVARGCSNLQTLNLRGCENITSASVSEIARRCSNLQTFSASSSITDASVSEVARGCSNLKTLNLEGCENITDASLLEVARGCPDLQSLNLGDCRNITDASVLEVARRCSNLQTLNLRNCSNITDASVMEVARGCLNLQTLNLRYCKNITDASVSEVARGCSNLQTLNLCGCRNITDASVMEVARGCSNLQSLDLRSCENITDASVLEVARRCSNLQTLNLRGCSITDACQNDYKKMCETRKFKIIKN